MSDPKSIKWSTGGTMRFAGLGVELAASVAGACIIGYWIDRRFETGSWGLLICALIGVVGGLYNMLRQAVDGLTQPGERTNQEAESKTNGKADS